MNRLLRCGALAISLLATGFGGYVLGGHLAMDSLTPFFLETQVETNIRELRHDLGILNALEESQADTAFKLIQARYFSRAMMIESLRKEHPDLIANTYIDEQLGEATARFTDLQYRFPIQKLNEEWQATFGHSASKTPAAAPEQKQ
ncbi:hypothetical protein [Atopomonas sediminilitoris]|uniref:hypothetical protein n=1 Tax=Atopomonas sediminilitoris TaxID=2919919 RepID=UPI001F4D9C8E|nr:hypothetical protein [Atopomonas sediminilitoris]MCJ8168533.1 hypothetical protein [Atopomonas sediminilitoris]